MDEIRCNHLSRYHPLNMVDVGMTIVSQSQPDTVTDDGTICGKCGVMITSGMWPFCPHPLSAEAAAIQRDDIPGGLVCENYGPNPITFYSHSERRAYMREHGLHETERFCPMPGTDIDPQGIPNPKGYMDPQTLKNGTILLTRRKTEAEDEGLKMTNPFNITATKRDAVAVAEGNTKRSSRIGRRIRDNAGR